MGVNRLFWPQEMMNEWIVDEKASISEEILTIVDEDVKYRISQALHFVSDVGDGSDPHDLLGKVKNIEVILGMGAEHYMDSVLIDDSAYQVVEGFTGEPIVEVASRSIKGDISQAVKNQAGAEEPEDRELLASFLLDNL